jgi:hypothetical protein
VKRYRLNPLKLHSDESGLFAVSHLATTLFLTVTAICTLNSGASLTDRVRHQRQADTAAESLGVWKARYLNAVVSHQHLMGELAGLVVTHHAIGGDLLDRHERAATRSVDRKLEQAYQVARFSRTGTPAYPAVSSAVFAGEALLTARKRLKRLLTKVYYAKAVATAMQAYPPTHAAGVALEQAADKLERAIDREWQVLDQVHQAARSLSNLKLKIVNEHLPTAKQQLDDMVENYEATQDQLASFIAQTLEIQIHILPTDRRLPLKEDPWARRFDFRDWSQPDLPCDCPSVAADNPRHQITKITQLARATFPWVNYHREPIERQLKPITPLSEMAELFFDHTNGVSKRMLDEQQRESQWSLFVLDDFEGPDKARESWTKDGGSTAADKSFGISVLVGKPTRQPIGSFFFRPIEPETTYRCASALVWNVVPPSTPLCPIDLYCKRIVPSTQAVTGWDTLNWSPRRTLSELVGIGVPHVFPAIEPGWRSSLSPTSAARLQEFKHQPGPAWADDFIDMVPDEIAPGLPTL